MDPVTILNEALAGLNAVLSIINAIRGQSGMTDDAILAAAQAQELSNATQIQTILAGLPPKS